MTIVVIACFTTFSNIFFLKFIFQESKNYLVLCPSPPKLSPGRLFHSSPSSATLPKRFDYNSEFSRFKSQGWAEITSFAFTSKCNSTKDMKNSQLKKISEKMFVNCMESSKEFVLRDVAYNSNLSGTLVVQLKTEIDLECSETSGFLTVGENFQGKWIWNRRWCKINGLTMLFWNYPQENMEKVCLLYLFMLFSKNY